MEKVGFGGGCHWCTEAVFQSLIGVEKVEQGWISSFDENTSYSEAVVVHFDSQRIDLKTLISIHLQTHSSTSNHVKRNKYRSAVYAFNVEQQDRVKSLLTNLQSEFPKQIITQSLMFSDFRENEKRYQNYYEKNSSNQFCTTYIEPKLKKISKNFMDLVNPIWFKT